MKWFTWVWFLPGAVALVLFANSLANGFVLDDTLIVERNEQIRSLHHVPAILSSHYWGRWRANDYTYRPLTILTYALNYAAGGANHTFSRRTERCCCLPSSGSLALFFAEHAESASMSATQFVPSFSWPTFFIATLAPIYRLRWHLVFH